MSVDNNSLSAVRPVIGVGVLIWRDKKLLLGERAVKDRDRCWQFPGGYLEGNESVIECARREVREETSLKVKNLRHLGFTDKTFDAVKHKVITLLISCEFSSGEAKLLEPQKCSCWKWFDYDNLPVPLFEPTANFLTQLDCARSAEGRELTSKQSDLYALHCAAQVLVDVPSGGHI